MQVKSESYLKSGSNELRVLEYKVGNLSFGINILKVSSIVKELTNFTKVPDSHPAVTGIFNDRNSLVPTIDLAKFLGIEHLRTQDVAHQKVIVTEFFERTNGFFVDDISWIHHFVWSDLIDTASVLRNIECPHVAGIVRPDGGDHMVLMLDYESIILNICPKLEKTGHSDSAEIPDFDASGMRALVAEDSPAVRAMLEIELLDCGFDVTTVADGQTAIDKINGEERFDLVVSDVEMPRVDGLALLVAIREKFGRDVPVIIYSSIGDRGMKKRAEFLEADAHITKLNMNQLRMEISNILSKRKTATPNATIETEIHVEATSTTEAEPAPESTPMETSEEVSEEVKDTHDEIAEDIVFDDGESDKDELGSDDLLTELLEAEAQAEDENLLQELLEADEEAMRGARKKTAKSKTSKSKKTSGKRSLSSVA